MITILTVNTGICNGLFLTRKEAIRWLFQRQHHNKVEPLPTSNGRFACGDNLFALGRLVELEDEDVEEASYFCVITGVTQKDEKDKELGVIRPQLIATKKVQAEAVTLAKKIKGAKVNAFIEMSTASVSTTFPSNHI